MLSWFYRHVSEDKHWNINSSCSFIHRAPATQIQPPSTHTHALIKLREGEPENKRWQWHNWGTETNWEWNWGGAMGEDGDCVLNIPRLIVPCSSSSWLFIRGVERESASDKDNKDSLHHTRCGFIMAYEECMGACCPNRWSVPDLPTAAEKLSILVKKRNFQRHFLRSRCCCR